MTATPSIPSLVNGDMLAVLRKLLEKWSKHSNYQKLHPWIHDLVGPDYSPPGKHEPLRWNYMAHRLNFTGKSVLDIGANTGYFSLGSLQQGATKVKAFEGNQEHALFLYESARLLGLSAKLTVVNEYFIFESNRFAPVDVVLCLNVLHHLGSDFLDTGESIHIAKEQMHKALVHLATYAEYCWLQIGFNWKGDIYSPLFQNGLKSELINFIRKGCGEVWTIKDIAIYNPVSQSYEPLRDVLLPRYDDIGEFLNRPLFLLQSCLHNVAKGN